ncbi:MAG: S41 family peptidase [Bacteroidota bacterium]|nr:S41 family peptidase [Bacteroidota bacterium]
MKKISILIAALTMFISCYNDDNKTSDPLTTDVDLQIRNFVWKGLNLYYLWQEDVPNLSDTRFANQNELNTFVKQSPNPTTLFNSLLYERGVIDRFSVIFNDYTVLEQVLSGNSNSNGIDYGLFRKEPNSDQIIGWVRYVMPNSDAETKNIKRGDLFYAINGTILTASNYRSLLANESYTMHFANYDNGNYTPNNQVITLNKHEYSENPVFHTQVYEINNHKIGYLMYNGFFGDYDSQLNNAFGYLASESVTDLILDLRYNSGGLISSATSLASMITGQYTNQVFASQQWNAKVMAYFEQQGQLESLINRFRTNMNNGEAINHLNLNRIYILTSASTASASELIINGLKPYIQVIQIGGKTTGKNVGSITLYDSPTYGVANRNNNHKYAMQPLTLKIVNSTGFGDYQTGIIPNIELHENMGNIKPIGDPSELFLATAISTITGTPPPSADKQIDNNYFSDSKAIEPLKTEMYINNVEFNLDKNIPTLNK